MLGVTRPPCIRPHHRPLRVQDLTSRDTERDEAIWRLRLRSLLQARESEQSKSQIDSVVQVGCAE